MRGIGSLKRQFAVQKRRSSGDRAGMREGPSSKAQCSNLVDCSCEGIEEVSIKRMSKILGETA